MAEIEPLIKISISLNTILTPALKGEPETIVNVESILCYDKSITCKIAKTYMYNYY